MPARRSRFISPTTARAFRPLPIASRMSSSTIRRRMRVRAGNSRIISATRCCAGLSMPAPDDLVLLSDVDEIVSAEKLRIVAGRDPSAAEISCFELRHFNFYLNWETPERWLRSGPRAVRRRFLDLPHRLRAVRGPKDGFADAIRAIRTARLMGRPMRRHLVRDAGWHFTYLGGPAAVQDKLKSFVGSEKPVMGDGQRRHRRQTHRERNSGQPQSAIRPRAARDRRDISASHSRTSRARYAALIATDRRRHARPGDSPRSTPCIDDSCRPATSAGRVLGAFVIRLSCFAAASPRLARVVVPRRAQSAPPCPPTPNAPVFMSDWGGQRTILRDCRGINIGINYIGEVLDVASGGIRRAASFEGRLEVVGDVDLEKLAGWTGASAHAKIFQIHNGGRNAADNVGSIFDPSNIDALPHHAAVHAVVSAEFRRRARSRSAPGSSPRTTNSSPAPTAGGLINGTFGWAGDPCRQYAKRRAGLSAGDAGPAASGQADAGCRRCSARCFPAIPPAPIARSIRRSATATARPSRHRAARCGSRKRSLSVPEAIGASRRLQDRRLACDGGLRRPALRHRSRDRRGAVARRSGDADGHPAPRQFGLLRRRRPDDLARGRAQRQCVPARRRRAVGSQSGVVLCRWRHRHQGPVRRAGPTIF